MLVLSVGMISAVTAQGNHYDFSAISGGKTLYYRIANGEAIVTYPKNTGGANYYVGHAKPTGDLVVPASVTYNGVTYAVTAIDDHAFYNCSNLASVSIDAPVTSIGDSALMGCSNLVVANLGESLQSIGYAAFRGCSNLPRIILPEWVSTIDNYAFFGCASLKKITALSLNPPTVTGNTLSADTLALHCDAMTNYQVTFPWNTYFPTVVGIAEDLPRVYDTVTARCSYQWYGMSLEESSDSMAYIGVQPWVCDTLHVLNLTIIPYSYDTVFDTLTLCYGTMPYNYGDTVLNIDMESGDYTFLFHSQEGCDSAVALHLTVNASVQTELCMVSVDNGHNLVMWPKTLEVSEYNIYREGVTTGDYELVATIPYDSLSLWVDETSRPVTRSYRYRITSVDLCGIESEESTVHKTMHLTINQGINNSWNLIWTEYEGASYSGYQIYRGHSADDMELIDEMPADGNTSYTDPNVEQDTVYYQVAIVKDEPCLPTKGNNLIFSNIATNNPVGIMEIENSKMKIHVADGHIVVDYLGGNQYLPVQVYDVMGRQYPSFTSRVSPYTLPNGVYFVKVDASPAHRIVVIR